jgi:S1-C subfamily serine protease
VTVIFALLKGYRRWVLSCSSTVLFDATANDLLFAILADVVFVPVKLSESDSPKMCRAMFSTKRLAVLPASPSLLGLGFEHAAKARVRRAVSVIIVLAGPLTCAAGGTPPAGYAALVRQVAPSVVTVLVEEEHISAGERAAERATSRSDQAEVEAIIRRLLSGPSGNPSRGEGASSALGSGFIIGADGLVVTNRHVIVDARTVRVRLADSREVAAQVIGSDAVTDIALLRVNAGRLPALRLGSSESVSVGDAVIAIGNPLCH